MFLRLSKNSSFLFKRAMSTMSKEFEEAVKKLALLKEEPDNSTKLKLYALFKQASVGECTTSKPGMLDMVGRAKWTAWKELGGLPQVEAQANYSKLIKQLTTDESSSSSSSSEGDLLTGLEGKIYKIVFNRPNKKNALKREMYGQFEEALKQARESEASIAVVTGTGTHYSSGNDLTNFSKVDLSNMKEEARMGAQILKTFVSSLIDFPKPLVALVNGPCIGIAATTLGLFDAVYASDKATFHTPFTLLGQSPEGCSSVTFPAIFGTSLATEILFFNRKISAQQAKEAGFVSEVIPSTSFEEETWKRMHELSLLPPQSLMACKRLVKAPMRQLLHETNERECLQLAERFASEECKQAVFAFLGNKL